MVEEYIKDLETIEIEVKTVSKSENATTSQIQTLVEMLKKHEILWLANILALRQRIKETEEDEPQDMYQSTLVNKLLEKRE